MDDQPRKNSFFIKVWRSLLLLAFATYWAIDISRNGFGHMLYCFGCAVFVLLIWFLLKDIWAAPPGAERPTSKLSTLAIVPKSTGREILRGLTGGLR